MKRALFVELQVARARKRPAAVVTNVLSGDQLLVDGDHLVGDLTLDDAQMAAVRYAIEEDRSGLLEDSYIFVHVFNPPLRMIVVGAVHIAQYLIPMATLAGYDVTLVDPRQAWATDARFPDIKVRHDWPDDAMRAMKPDRRTAVVTLTHDPKLDDPALEGALKSAAFYIGALGSTRTHSKRLERLREAGIGADDLVRIHGPIGLAVGARSPAEIAVAILAQVIQVRHGAPPLIRAEAAE